ncbi:alpha/beta hydrolase fold domain-containing protein [Streptosporangium canum]
MVWTAKNAAELGIDPDRLAVAGISAGGGLAAATVLLARDRGGPSLAFQMLICPMLDDRNTTPSSHEFAEAVVWNRAANLFGWAALLGDDAGTDGVSPYAAPARATDLSGLPPAYIDVGELEVFRDECGWCGPASPPSSTCIRGLPRLRHDAARHGDQPPGRRRAGGRAAPGPAPLTSGRSRTSWRARCARRRPAGSARGTAPG